MPLPWYRSYSSDLHDALIQNLSLQDFKYWQNLQWLANEQTPRGCLPGAEQVGFNLHISAGKAAKLLNDFRERGLLVPDKEGRGLVPFNGERSFRESDDKAAAMADKRARDKAPVLPTSGLPVTHKLPIEEEERRSEQEGEREKDLEADREPDTEAEEAENELSQIRHRLRGCGISWLEAEMGEAWSMSGLDCVLHCIDEAVRYNRLSWAYVESVRIRHVAEGCPPPELRTRLERLVGREV